MSAKGPTSSKRYEVIGFLLSAAVVSYMLRVNVSVAAQKMRDEFGWSETQKGLVLSAFFWGYGLGQIPACVAADSFGGKTSLGFAILGSSTLTLLVPLAAHTSFTLLLVLRAFTGVVQAAAFPSIYYFFPRWIPIKEKTVMVTMILSGIYLGEILGFGLSGALVGADTEIEGHSTQGWELVFYIFGLIGLLWCPLFYWRVYNSPDVHPGCTANEFAFIKEGNFYYDALFLLQNEEEDEKSVLNSVIDQRTPLLRGDSDDKSVLTTGQGQGRLTSRSSLRSKSRSVSEALMSGTNAPAISGFIGLDKEVEVKYSMDHSSPLKEKIEISVKNHYLSSIPWEEIFTNQACVTLLIGAWASGWIGYMVLTEMPAYLNDELGYDLSESGFLSVIPYVFNFISVQSGGRIFDYCQRERGWSTRDVRQWATRIAFLGASSCLIISGFMESKTPAFIMMILALFFFGFVISGLNCATLDVSPNFVMMINAVSNIVGSVAGFTGPLVVSLFLSLFETSKLAWKMVFFLTAFFCVVSLIHFKIYQTSDVVMALNMPAKRK